MDVPDRAISLPNGPLKADEGSEDVFDFFIVLVLVLVLVLS